MSLDDPVASTSRARPAKSADEVARLERKLKKAQSALRKAKGGDRKTSAAPATARKAVKASELRWVKDKHAKFDGFDAEGGGYELEEIDDVEVVYGADRTIKFMARETAIESEEEEWVPARLREDADEIAQDYAAAIELDEAKIARIDDSTFDSSLLPEYAACSDQLRPTLLRALYRLGFATPTAIQTQVWSTALSLQRDVVGVAETGSGKTLAYGLPILQYILERPAEDAGKPAALVLAPTRELAMQVRQHLNDVISAACQGAEEGKTDKQLPIRVVAITGGLSAHKQRRLLAQGSDILIATPGRLWDLAQTDTALSTAIRQIRFFVLDEADRMVETGHYAELDRIFALLRRKASGDEAYQDDFGEDEERIEAREDLRTFVFSATMDKKLQINLKRRKGKAAKLAAKSDTLADLLETLDFRDPDPLIIDLTTERAVAEGLKECMTECLTKEKVRRSTLLPLHTQDLFLYLFLLRYPARTLVFLSAIDGIRRLLPLLTLLGIDVVAIHSGMQQRARLKALDRFRASSTCVMLATDVAARGLDVPGVEHVVHFQLPRTADAYVHRSGRTGRAGRQGLGLILCAPEEKANQKALFKQLGRDDTLDELPIEYGILTKLRERIEVAKKIEQAEHRVSKANSDRRWLEKAAEDVGVDLSDDADSDGASKKRKKADAKVAALKAELRSLLAQPLLARGISARYLTSSIGDKAGFVDTLIAQSHHQTLMGVPKRAALDDVGRPQKRRKV